jgi:signal transduction histidine kinase
MTDFLIICVDADPTTRSSLEADIGRLTGDQFDVETYPDGRRALARAEELTTSEQLVPLMIAADHLTDMRGVDLLMAVHQQPRLRGTRKVLLSADPAMEDVGRAIGKRSLDGILPYPWSEERLHGMLDSLITEFFIEHAPGDLERIPGVVDVTLLSDAFSAAERKARTTDRQLRKLQRSFLTDREMPDDEVEQQLIAELDSVLLDTSRKHIPAGSPILASGDVVDGIQVLVEGAVRLTRQVGGREVVFHSETAGRIIGLLAVARNRPSFFNVTAETDVVVLPVSLDDLDTALQLSPTLAIHLVTVMVRSMARRMLRGVDQQIRIDQLNRELGTERDQLAATLKELENTQAHLVETEKMATLGQLVAGIGHELNNPVAAIERAADFLRTDIEAVAAEHPDGRRLLQVLEAAWSTSPLSTRDERRYRSDLAAALNDAGLARRLVRIGITSLDEYQSLVGGSSPGSDQSDLDRVESYHQLGVSLRNLRSSADRIAALVQSLRSYARAGREMSDDIDIHDSLEETLLLFGHDLREIQVEREYGDLPPIDGYPGQLNQVWTNLISNAIQAMERSGTLRIHTDAPDPAHVRVRVIDSGPGIDPDHVDQVFDMHFTTREGRVEFGLGLGLRIAQDIVVRHAGTIEVESQPGRTCFTVVVPVRQLPDETHGDQP